MFALTSRLETEFGLRPEQVEAGVGTVLNFLSVMTGPNVTQGLHGIEDTRDLMRRAPTPDIVTRPSSNEPSAVELRPLVEELNRQGISPEAALRFTSVVLGFIRSKIGAATFESMLESVPTLRSLDWGNDEYIGTETLV